MILGRGRSYESATFQYVLLLLFWLLVPNIWCLRFYRVFYLQERVVQMVGIKELQPYPDFRQKMCLKRSLLLTGGYEVKLRFIIA